MQLSFFPPTYVDYIEIEVFYFTVKDQISTFNCRGRWVLRALCPGYGQNFEGALIAEYSLQHLPMINKRSLV